MTLPADADFTPELGQALSSNTPWKAHELSRSQSEDLNELAEAIGRHRGDYQEGWGSLASNSGSEEYTGPVFDMRCYCWCDGDRPGHEESCPPNFHHHATGIQVAWYKHAGRGASINQKISSAHWKRVIAECRDSVPITDDEIDAQRHREKTVCKDCQASAEDLDSRLTPEDEACIAGGGRCVKCQRAYWDEMDRDMREMEADGSLVAVVLGPDEIRALADTLPDEDAPDSGNGSDQEAPRDA